ncbi:unnamed protein product [Phytophthora fragariaefolia]|uniref:Unnamed protein product n=1 Tax=Phytophthora fragariaefolia TaxID=1490495 RepID=A0A9W6Y4V6_9STRA|nr:unnamed protein product [Phytophthora fragariaefolia]
MPPQQPRATDTAKSRLVALLFYTIVGAFAADVKGKVALLIIPHPTAMERHARQEKCLGLALLTEKVMCQYGVSAFGIVMFIIAGSIGHRCTCTPDSLMKHMQHFDFSNLNT